MQINLLNIPVVDPVSKQIVLHAFNLAPYKVHAVDVYLLCSDTAKNEWLLTPSIVNGTEVSKLSVQIDSTVFDISKGQQGESPTNPIVFERSTYSSLVVDSLDSSKTEGSIAYSPNALESQVQVDDNIGTLVPGQNIILDDYLPIKIIVNDPMIVTYDTYAYGGSVDGQVYDGYGGTKTVDGLQVGVEGWGGIVPNNYLDGVTIIIEKSKYIDNINIRENGIGVENYGIRY